MASQPVHPASSCVEISSFIRGYHAYQDIWQPTLGESLLLQSEPTNTKDSLAVSVVKSNTIVGHVPANLSVLFSHFLSRRCNKGTAEVTGARLNRGAGYGLKIPCKYRLYGPAAYIERLKTIIRGDEFEDSDHQSSIASMP